MSGWNFYPRVKSSASVLVVIYCYKRSKQALRAFRITGVYEHRALWAKNTLLLAEMKQAGSFQSPCKGEESLKKGISSSTAKLCSRKQGNSNTGLGSKAGQVQKLPVTGEMVSPFSAGTPPSCTAMYTTAASSLVRLSSSHWLWCNSKQSLKSLYYCLNARILLIFFPPLPHRLSFYVFILKCRLSERLLISKGVVPFILIFKFSFLTFCI